TNLQVLHILVKSLDSFEALKMLNNLHKLTLKTVNKVDHLSNQSLPAALQDCKQLRSIHIENNIKASIDHTLILLKPWNLSDIDKYLPQLNELICTEFCFHTFGTRRMENLHRIKLNNIKADNVFQHLFSFFKF